MTLKEFTRYLHRHIGYSFYPMSQNEYSIYGFVDNFKGYIKEEKGKFYIRASAQFGYAILNSLDISYQRILHYESIECNHYRIHYGIYEISIQQDKATHS